VTGILVGAAVTRLPQIPVAICEAASMPQTRGDTADGYFTDDSDGMPSFRPQDFHDSVKIGKGK
jgi:hypothetical protein